MFLIDSHCHLNQLDYKETHKDVSDVLYKARQKGIRLVLSVSVSLFDYENMIQIIGYRNDVLFSCGVHPTNIFDIRDFDYDKLYNLASGKYTIAVGETGLDYYKNKINQNIQKEVFRQHIAIAKKLNKPLIVHSRCAIMDTIVILKEESAEKCGGILHCFSEEDINIVRTLLNMNFYISFSGIVTFSRSHIFKKVINYVPLDRILIETDSPYLTPVPYRGKENQPAYVYEIAKYVSDIKRVSLKYLARSTTSNFYKLFRCIL